MCRIGNLIVAFWRASKLPILHFAVKNGYQIVVFMLSKNNQGKQEIKEQQDHNNLVQFFDLLLKIDQRENPELYKVKTKEKEND